MGSSGRDRSRKTSVEAFPMFQLRDKADLGQEVRVEVGDMIGFGYI